MKKLLYAIFALVAISIPVFAAPANVLTDAVTDAVYEYEPYWYRWNTSNDLDTIVTSGADTIGGRGKYFAIPTGWEYFLIAGPASSAGQDSFALRVASISYDPDKRAQDSWLTIDTIKTADTLGTTILLPWNRTQIGAFYRLVLQGVTGAGANDTAIVNQRNFTIGRRRAVLNTPAVGYSLPR